MRTGSFIMKSSDYTQEEIQAFNEKRFQITEFCMSCMKFHGYITPKKELETV